MPANLVKLAAFADRHVTWPRERDRQILDDRRRPPRHHQHAVGEHHRLTDAVRHKQRGLGVLLPQIEQQLVHLVAGDRVERAERLVHQQQLGVIDQRPADRDALAHPARQLVRLFVGEAMQPDAIEQRVRRVVVVVDRALQDADREQHVVERALPRQQGRILEHDADAGARTGHRSAVDDDAAGGHRLKASDHHQQRALAAAGGTENGDELAVRYRKADRAHRFDRVDRAVAVDFADFGNLDTMLRRLGGRRTLAGRDIKRYRHANSLSSRRASRLTSRRRGILGSSFASAPIQRRSA